MGTDGEEPNAGDLEIINRHPDRLNDVASDVLAFQVELCLGAMLTSFVA